MAKKDDLGEGKNSNDAVEVLRTASRQIPAGLSKKSKVSSSSSYYHDPMIYAAAFSYYELHAATLLSFSFC